MTEAPQAESKGPESKGAGSALGIAAVAVVLPVLLAAWLPVLPRLDFDLDPRVPGSEVRATLGAAGFGGLALAGTLAAWAGIGVSVAAGGRLRWASAALVLAGVAAAAWHAGASFENAHAAAGWVWAASAGLAAAHLGRHPSARRWLLALPVALLVPLAFQAGWYRWVSHPATVQAYEAAVAAGTWAGPGSGDPSGAAARLYERRLRINDATGPFGFANVLGTVAAGLGLAALATLPRPSRCRGGSGAGSGSGSGSAAGAGVGAIAVGACAAVGGAGLVLLTHSAGAMAAGAAGALVFAAAWVACGRPGASGSRVSGRLLGVAVPAMALSLVAGVVLVVAVRGWVGPPPPEVGVAAERTLLFRSQYWAGAARLWAEGAAWLGLGPGGFAAAYARVKTEIAPETVTSTHNVVVDFAVMLGVGGLCWAAVLLGWLFAAARAVATGAKAAQAATAPATAPAGIAGGVAGATGPGPVRRPEVYATAAIAAALLGVEAWVRLPELSSLELGGRLLAGVGFVGVALVVRRATARGAALATLAAAVAVLVHAQLDMAFFLPSAAPLLWLMVGLAAGVGQQAAGVGQQAAGVGQQAAGIGQQAAGIGQQAAGIGQQAAGVGEQAAGIDEQAAGIDEQAAGDVRPPRRSVGPLGALAIAGVFATGVVSVSASRLHRHAGELASAAAAVRAGQVDAAVSGLRAASAAVGKDSVAQNAAVGLLLEVALAAEAARRPDIATRWLQRAEALAAQAGESAARGEAAARLARALAASEAPPAEVAAARARAVEAFEASVEASPTRPERWLRLAEALDETGRGDDARAARVEALRLDEALYLDPDTQMRPADRARVEARL